MMKFVLCILFIGSLTDNIKFVQNHEIPNKDELKAAIEKSCKGDFYGWSKEDNSTYSNTCIESAQCEWDKPGFTCFKLNVVRFNCEDQNDAETIYSEQCNLLPTGPARITTLSTTPTRNIRSIDNGVGKTSAGQLKAAIDASCKGYFSGWTKEANSTDSEQCIEKAECEWEKPGFTCYRFLSVRYNCEDQSDAQAMHGGGCDPNQTGSVRITTIPTGSPRNVRSVEDGIERKSVDEMKAAIKESCNGTLFDWSKKYKIRDGEWCIQSVECQWDKPGFNCSRFDYVRYVCEDQSEAQTRYDEYCDSLWSANSLWSNSTWSATITTIPTGSTTNIPLPTGSSRNSRSVEDGVGLAGAKMKIV